ncbi:hypothetical protein HanPSC8_Chr16g0700481 [Helianthus annuus]|nr:hypothetical protein HanPSC8_Chr16g0700481 [Helianthus annuus]
MWHLISRTLGLHFADFSTFLLNLDAFELRKGQKTCEFRTCLQLHSSNHWL